MTNEQILKELEIILKPYDEKIQEYTIAVCDTDILITEYHIVETGGNRWRIYFEYQEVQYLLSITNMEQREVEKIVNNLCF